MTASKVEELRMDIEELKSLSLKATRQRVKDMLSLDLRKVETELIKLQEQISKEDEKSKTLGSATPTIAPTSGNRCYDVKIMNYAWDQSDKFVKIFLTLKNVHTIPAENILCNFGNQSMELHVNNLENRNHNLAILNLLEEIDPVKSHWKVKEDKLTIYMAKVKAGQKWSHLNGLEKQATEKKTPKYEPSPSDDPSASMMGLLKQMYNEGDDEMKRTIAKAWSTKENTTF